MSITDSFKNAVASADISGLRIMLKDSLLVDPTFTKFAEMIEFAQHIPGIIDNHDGREFISDKSLWNDDYLNMLKVQIVRNFSWERINHLKEVIRYLEPAAAKQQAGRSENRNTHIRTEVNRPDISPMHRTSYQEQKRQDERDNRITKIVTGSVVGGVVGGAVVAVVSGSAIAVTMGAITGAAVVGAVVSKITN